MNDVALERAIEELFAGAPRLASPAGVDRAIAQAATLPQRRPRVARLDRRVWPPVARGITDPAVHRAGRLALAAVLVLVIGALVAVGARLLDRPPTVDLVSGGALPSHVVAPSAILWPDGRILVQGQGGSRYLFDTESGVSDGLTFGDGWGSARADVLSDGRVVLTKRPEVSDSTNESIDFAFYDVASGEVQPFGSVATPWFGEAIIFLRDGRILISGGIVPPDDMRPCSKLVCEGFPLATMTPDLDLSEGAKDVVRRFDPATGQITEVGRLAVARGLHQMIELDDGRILVLGGGDYGADPTAEGEALAVEVLDLSTGSSKVVGRLEPAHFPLLPRGVRLADGRVLINGGAIAEYPCGTPRVPAPGEPIVQVPEIDHQVTYVFDPGEDRVTDGPVLPHFYGGNNVVPLADGRALAFGYFYPVPADCSPQPMGVTNPWLAIIDLERNTVFESDDRMTGLAGLDVAVTREYGAAVRLRDGRVALIGDHATLREDNAIDLVTVGP
jgi:hypothetical protein